MAELNVVNLQASVTALVNAQNDFNSDLLVQVEKIQTDLAAIPTGDNSAAQAVIDSTVQTLDSLVASIKANQVTLDSADPAKQV